MKTKLFGALAASAASLALVAVEGSIRPALASDAKCGGGIDVQCRVVRSWNCIEWKLQPTIGADGGGYTWTCARYEDSTDYYYYPRAKAAE